MDRGLVIAGYVAVATFGFLGIAAAVGLLSQWQAILLWTGPPWAVALLLALLARRGPHRFRGVARKILYGSGVVVGAPLGLFLGVAIGADLLDGILVALRGSADCVICFFEGLSAEFWATFFSLSLLTLFCLGGGSWEEL